MTTVPFLSVIVPVYNGGGPFIDCLVSLTQSSFQDWELIVVDDGSSDKSASLAAQFGARVLTTDSKCGPGAARNLGAQAAVGSYLYFVDADCEVHPDTLAQVAAILQGDPGLDAMFGSYDDAPGAGNFVAQYKNLFHHYVHQQSNEIASTFWAGCGAVKRTVFLALGGFDVRRYARPSIEDIDLGFRIKLAGGRIRLAKEVQVKHHKAWRLGNLVRTDLFDRGIPWARLILQNRLLFVNDLNLQTHNRISVVANYCLPLGLAASLLWTQGLVLVAAVVAFILTLNIDVYRFFYRKRGLLFTLRVIPLHWLYYLYSGLAMALGLALYWRDRFKRRTFATPEALIRSGD